MNFYLLYTFTVSGFRHLLFIILIICSIDLFAQNARSVIIPKPVQMEMMEESFTITPSTGLVSLEPALNKTSSFLNQAIKSYSEFTLPVKKNFSPNIIILQTDPKKVDKKEGYLLRVSKNNIEITGHDEAGVFYAVQSLIQLFEPGNKKITIQGVKIEDYPRFEYRGMHLDAGRHFFPVSFIKKYIDLLSFYKLNTFHWHLTEDQGWRIEIKKYPKLQSIAAFRKETLIGHKKELPHRFDGKKYGGYYTQAEVKDIVQYAADRQVTILPEIEMPGHALAALSAYPQLGCTGAPYSAATFWGIFDDVFCAGNDSTFIFLQNVLDEVIQLFPSKYIHVGGDECPKTKWQKCDKCQRRIKAEGLKDEHELQSYFIQRVEKYLNSKDRQLIGWDEILEGGLAPGATVMSWRGEAGGIAAAKQKHDVIMTPENMVYFDHYQSLHPDEKLAAGGYTPVSEVYSYEPLPSELSIEEQKFIKGIQGNVWTEYLHTGPDVEYMVFPRAIALAEVGWTKKENKEYADFLRRLRLHRELLKKRHVNYADNFDEIIYSIGRGDDGKVELALSTTYPNAVIRYTLDGSVPTLRSNVYDRPVVITKSGIVKALLFNDHKPAGRIFQQSFHLHKAIGKTVTLTYPPQGNYNPGNPFPIVNGVEGNHRYNNGQWLGFSGENLEAVIDLGSLQNITSVGMNVLTYHWQRMWAPVTLTFYASENGSDFKQIYSQDKFPLNGINKVRATIPPVKTRYIKVVAVNKGIIPAGEYGAGGKAWLLADEIVVE